MSTKIGTWNALVILALLVFGLSLVMESAAWARAGGGRSMGSRGGRSFSSPSSPSSPSFGSPGLSGPSTRLPGQSSGGFFSRSPFLQGMAGGLAGGLLGGMLFGGTGHAAAGGAMGGGIGLFDILLLGLLAYFGWRFYKRRRMQATSYSSGDVAPGYLTPPPFDIEPRRAVDRGFAQQPMELDADALKEDFQDLFFRIQAGWMNRSLDGIEGLLTPEMAGFFRTEFEGMRKSGRINRLENIAIRRVEPSETWQEMGKDFVTVLITANLLDYTVDEVTGQVVSGDKLNPVKFQEFWTFCREPGNSTWKLSAINQASGASASLG